MSINSVVDFSLNFTRLAWALPFFFVYLWCDVTGVGVKQIVDGVVK